MNGFWGLLLLSSLWANACYRELPTETPTLSPEELKLILKDVHVAESMLTEVPDRRTKDSLARIYYGQIFRIHGIDPMTFDENMSAYFTDPYLLDSLYGEAIKELKKEKEVLKEEQQARQEKRAKKQEQREQEQQQQER